MSQRSVFITGISSGLGAGLARHYLAAGDRVIGCSRRSPPSDMICPELKHTHIDLANLAAVPSQLPLLFADTTDCDLAILNAGVLSPFGDLQAITIEQCQQVMTTNVWANKVIIDWLLPNLPSLRQIVVISSGAAVNGNRGWNAYGISKAAVNMLTLLYSREASQVHFLAVAPGLIDTAKQDYLCNLPPDERFPALASLRARQQTELMPSGDELAPRLADIFQQAKERVDSGSFIDIRRLPW